MYIHIGNDFVVRDQDIIGIFDLDNTSQSKTTRAFLSKAQEEGRVVSDVSDLPKAFILSLGIGGDDMLYLSQLSSSTLVKRAR